MRIELLALVLTSACLQAAVVAENDITVIGDRGADALRGGPPPRCRVVLPFKLAHAARVWAEADGLQGQGRDRNAAPEAFVDEQYLGPLRVEHGQDWRSPQAVQLEAGEHALILRCAQVADADDVRMERVRVMREGDDAEGPKPVAKRGRQAKPTALPTAQPLAAAAPLSATPAVDCGHLKERVDWLNGAPPSGRILSVFTGRIVDGGSLVELKPGEAWTIMVKVPRGDNGMALALQTGWKADQGGRLCYLFSIDPEGAARPVRDARDYRPGAWQPLRFEFCGDKLSAKFAKAHAQSLTWRQAGVELVVGAQDLELGLRPVPSR